MTKRSKEKKSIREIETKRTYSGERSPYWDHMSSRLNHSENDDSRSIEDPIANPDMLSEDDHMYHRPLSEEGELQFQAIRKTVLSPQQRQVVQLCGFDGLTMRETGKILGLKIPTVQDYLETARRKIQETYLRLKGEQENER